MNKLANVAVEEPFNETAQESLVDGDELYVKRQKENEIRMKLAQFAKELSQIEKKRSDH
ncbi:MAG: hypothetical protein ABGX41_04505 [Pseudohongiella sp.]|jgi:hypothetical protein|nr:hypothetical protein [Gammaproteobacteria bacterium]|tara:strand:- start:700 stop:876 length:177 start_codon:yes stop_codon:yes gene_type:complete